MKTLQTTVNYMLVCLILVGITACGNVNKNSALQPAADSSAVVGLTAKADSGISEDDAASEAEQSKNIDEQMIRDVVNRSLDDEKCFSAEYVKLYNQASEVAEVRLWNILPGSVYVPKSITLNSLDIKSPNEASGKIRLTAVDFEDENDKQELNAVVHFIREDNKWVINDVDETKDAFRKCIKNAAE